MLFVYIAVHSTTLHLLVHTYFTDGPGRVQCNKDRGGQPTCPRSSQVDTQHRNTNIITDIDCKPDPFRRSDHHNLEIVTITTGLLLFR
jgi:hypothetical protein